MSLRRLMPSDPLLRLITIVGGLVAIASVLGGGARWAKSTADETYVKRDSFALYQQGIASQRRADSVANAAAVGEVLHILSGLDSSDRCRRAQQSYCR